MRTDGRTDVTQIIAAFRNFAKALKTVLTFVISSSPTSYLLSTILSLLPYALFILHIVFINLFLLIDPSFFFAFFSSHLLSLIQPFPYFLRRGALFRREIRHGALSSPLYQRHVCAYLAVFSELCFTSC